jgi:LysR family transcriptional regulator, benzoate and cis,cis-muconate-responsive activator of ben and cat genes
MELRHLRYFVAVAEEQNITRAAARLHVSQPPLSRQIRDLENELGVVLLERTPRAVRLTPAGWAFLEECYTVLRQSEQAVRVARAAASGGRGELKLGYAPGPTQDFLRELLRQLRASDPELRVELHDLTTEEMMAGLRAGKLDAALAVKPRPATLGELKFENLREDPLVVVMAREHRLAGRRSVAMTELAAEPFVVFSRREYPEHLEGTRELLGGPKVHVRIAEECDSGMTLFAAIEAGHGISILSSALAPVIGARLKLIPVRPAPPPNVIGLAYVGKTKHRWVERVLAAARVVANAGTQL